jgi:hypothetical protein
MDELIFAGNKYISSKRASKLTGYTTDYIGQICRADKIQCRLVGRNWYINEREIERNKKRFKKEQILGNKEQIKAIKYEKIEPELLYYNNDERSLNPEVSKIYTEEEKNNKENIPIRIITRPEVIVARNNILSITPNANMQIKIRQKFVPMPVKTRFPAIILTALTIVLIVIILTTGTVVLEQKMSYSSVSKIIDTNIQVANIKEVLNKFISFRQDSYK